MEKSIKIRTAVITGATSGIGFALTKSLVKNGTYVIGVGRSEQRNTIAKEKILSDFPSGQVDYINADLAKLEMVSHLAQEIKQRLEKNNFKHLDALINNAGVYLEKKQLTDGGIEKTFAVNHLAQFQLTHDLLSLLARAKQGKMISVSSYAHFTTPMSLKRIVNPWPYIGLLAYKRSKLCNVLFVRELKKRTDQIIAYSADPGLVNTQIGSKSGEGISSWVWSHHRNDGMAPETAAENLLYILTSEGLDPLGCLYIRDRKQIQPSKNARDDDLAERLWALSCDLTGLEW